MDGGYKQKKMSEIIKEEIKHNAQHRRERDNSSTNANGGSNFFIVSHRIADSPVDNLAINSNTTPETSNNSDINAIASRTADPVDHQPTLQENARDVPAMYNDSTLGYTEGPPSNLAFQFPNMFGNDHYELAFLMKYLDDVFPFLFPYYRPSLMETGRSWIISLLRTSNVARHAVLSLTTYFFTVLLTDLHPGEYERCKKEMWSRLGGQTESYIEQVQQEIKQLRVQPASTTVLQRVHTMEGIIQALLFEANLGRSDNWAVHLNAVLGLFNEIIQDCRSSEDTELSFMSLMNSIGKPAWYTACTPGSGSYIWTSDQAGFRFFSALLVYIDVIGSTSMRQRPRIFDHYSFLLADVDDGHERGTTIPLQLSRYLGCQNWVISAIAETAALSEWKTEARITGSLSILELVKRAQRIEKILDEGMLSINNCKPKSSNAKHNKLWQYCNHLRPPPCVSSADATEIWSCATRVYLAVVVSGWQPSNPEIRTGVQEMLRFLRNIHSPSHLRTFSWPIVVSGCLAAPGEERKQFWALLNDNIEVGTFGAMAEARNILVKVWENSGTVGCEDWDIASCLNILGYPALLI
jgi:hypothetical protein